MPSREDFEDEELLFLDPDSFDEAIIGTARMCGRDDVVAYSVRKVLAILEKDGMTHDEALEHFSFNIEGAYVGSRTPIYIDEHNGEREW